MLLATNGDKDKSFLKEGMGYIWSLGPWTQVEFIKKITSGIPGPSERSDKGEMCPWEEKEDV